MTNRITTAQRVTVSLTPMKADGTPARIDGDVRFTADPPGVVEIERIDATSAYLKGVRNGVTQIRAIADADLDAGEERYLDASGALEVVNAEEEATTLALTFGEPEEA